MAKFPEPPSVEDLSAIAPETHVLRAGTELWRVYFRSGAHPTLWGQLRSFGPTRARFDHHPAPPRVHADCAITYAAKVVPTALAEAFQDSRLIDRQRGSPWLAGFRLARDVVLLDLTQAWPTRAGASMNINSGPRPRAQRWSRRIHAAYPSVEGLCYSSSMNANAPIVALYERAASAIPPAPSFNRPLSDPALLAALRNAAIRVGYRLR